jgi:sugar phosphate isomerase/epimerase
MLEKYAGRNQSQHLSDWSATEKKPVPVGQGAIDWKKLFAAAKRAGVKNYFVEMDLDAMKASYAYLKELQA